MKLRNCSLCFSLCVSAAFTLAAIPTFAQHTRGAEMTIDSSDKACVELHDNNHWQSSLDDLDGIGTNYTLSNLIANGYLTSAAPEISSGHPPATGYANGFTWDPTDESTASWTPQGLTVSSVSGEELVFASWYWEGSGPNKGSRISVADIGNMSNVTYRDIIMVQVTGPGTYAPIEKHAGGVGAFLGGRYLYISETSGFHVFDLNNIRKVSTTGCTQSDGTPIFGKNSSGQDCAGGYEFMVPQVDEYAVPSTMEDGFPISSSCKPKFSWAGYDSRRSTLYLLSGEYCGEADGGEPCNGDSSYLNGRMYMWPADNATGKLKVDPAGYVAPWRVYYMNESDVQGIAADNNLNADGVTYPTDTYYLSSTYGNGYIYRAGLTSGTKSWSYGAGTAPYHPEGMYATMVPNMWIITEGNHGASTDPAGEGRSVFYLHQHDIR